MEEKIVKISELNARSKNEIIKLSYENKYLVPCKAEVSEEEIKFIYDLDNFKNISEIRKSRVVEKLRLLINASNVFDISNEYKINFKSDNVYYDYNFNIKLKDRDINLKEEIIDIEESVLKYKSLIGYVFSKDYEYDDFYNGGIDLLKKNKTATKYFDIQSIEDIRNELMNDLREKELYDSENIVEVSEKEFKRKKYSIYGMSAGLSLLLVYTIFTSVFFIPAKNKIIAADNYFIDKNYGGVINSLKSTLGIPLDDQAKYKLAYSYVIAQDLKQLRKDNILASITERTDKNILDYWIAIGSQKYDKAIDLSKSIGDNEYTLYAYVYKKKALEDDKKLSGTEKEKLLEEVNQKIKDYEDKVSQENTSTNNTDSSQNTAGASSTTNDATTEGAASSTNTTTTTTPVASGTSNSITSGVLEPNSNTQTNNSSTNSISTSNKTN